jgi:hypothetical protein
VCVCVCVCVCRGIGGQSLCVSNVVLTAQSIVPPRENRRCERSHRPKGSKLEAKRLAALWRKGGTVSEVLRKKDYVKSKRENVDTGAGRSETSDTLFGG